MKVIQIQLSPTGAAIGWPLK